MLLNACKNRKTESPSCESLSLSFQRFDQDVQLIDPNDPIPQIAAMKKQYGDFYAIYSGDPYPADSNNELTQSSAESMLTYMGFEPTKELFARSNGLFKDFSAYEQEIESILCQTLSQFPELPQSYEIITYLEEPHILPDPQKLHGINQMNDSLLTIGLQRYLGDDYEFYTYPGVQVFKYQLHRMNPEYISITFAEFFYEKHFRNYSKDENTLLFNMIEEGKKYYYMERVLGDVSPNMIIGYTEEEYEFAEYFEFYIWQTFLENELLYVTSNEEIKYYIGEAPHSKRMDERLPGNIGSFIGWQIVKTYAEKEGEPSLAELVALTPQDLFIAARYDPEMPNEMTKRSAWIIRILAGITILLGIGYFIVKSRRKKLSST